MQLYQTEREQTNRGEARERESKRERTRVSENVNNEIRTHTNHFSQNYIYFFQIHFYPQHFFSPKSIVNSNFHQKFYLKFDHLLNFKEIKHSND